MSNLTIHETEELRELNERIMAYFDMSYSYAVHKTKDTDLAKDIVQDMAVSIYKARPYAKALGESYFKTSIDNLVYNYMNTAEKRYTRATEVLPEATDVKSFEKQVHDRLEIQYLKGFMSAQEWTAVTMFADGYTYVEIYKKMGLTRDQLVGVFERLRKKMDEKRKSRG